MRKAMNPVFAALYRMQSWMEGKDKSQAGPSSNIRGSAPVSAVTALERQKQYFLVLLILTIVIFFVYNVGFVPANFSDANHRPPAYVLQPSRPRIMITYWGRMGNHMFEYATLIGVATRNNMTPLVPPGLDLHDAFKIPTAKSTQHNLGMYFSYYEEKPAAYYKATEKLRPFDAYLVGYYQSWKYFENVKEELLTQHYVFHEHIQKEANKFIADARREKNKPTAAIIGVHVRRGDFVRQKLKGYTAAPVSYFYKAMNYFRRKYKDVLFIICSNDQFWAEDNLDQGDDVIYSHIEDGMVDFAVLTSCKHIIITAGSYSWWAGYLVRGDVIYFSGFPEPNTKIGNMTVREDYYPAHWIGMK